jgi:hypothetical protein
MTTVFVLFDDLDPHYYEIIVKEGVRPLRVRAQ